MNLSLAKKKGSAVRRTAMQIEGENTIEALRDNLRQKSGPNLLRGWRVYFDSDGDLKCTFAELCVGCGKLGFSLDVQLLLDKSEGVSPKSHHHEALTFERLAPPLCHLLLEFRLWIKKNFDGPAEMFEKFDSFHKQDGSLSPEEFEGACVAFGFKPSRNCDGATITDLFWGLDLDQEGSITKDEVAIAESDDSERHAWLEELRRERDEAAVRMMSELHDRANYDGLSQTHRLRDRFWQNDVDKLPHVQLRKRRKRLEEARERREQSLKLFRIHLQRCYGEPIRCWRRVLTKGTKDCYKLERQRLLQYCRSVDFQGDSRSLWEALDKDRDESVSLEEVCPQHSEALAKLRVFLRSRPGIETCLQWFKETRLTHGKGVRRLNSKDLAVALAAEGYPYAHDVRHIRLMSQGLDPDHCGLIGPEDFQWLDGWNPPPWLSATPNHVALDTVKDLLVEHFGHVLTAWRQALDTDGSNRLSWEEFLEACKRMKFKGDCPGAWRALDDDLSGWISLKELSPDSHNALITFRSFVERNFGSVTKAFSTLDKDGSGELTFPEFRRACKRMRWKGDSQLLFNALDANQAKAADGKRQITLKEISYLDSYADDDLCDRLDSLNKHVTRPPKRVIPILSPTDFDKGTTMFYCTKGHRERDVWKQQRQEMQKEWLASQAAAKQQSSDGTAGGGSWPDVRCDWRERWHMARTAPAGMKRASSTGALSSSAGSSWSRMKDGDIMPTRVSTAPDWNRTR